MAYLADTNVAARWALPSDPLHAICRAAVENLHAAGELVYITAQNLVEFQALATRPVSANGLGMSPADASATATLMESTFPLAEENREVYPLWRNLVDTYSVVGRQVYDARLVAVMQSSGLTHLLTLNGPHFRQFPGITVVAPNDV
jgi:predicted nucleic acid-binding protein